MPEQITVNQANSTPIREAFLKEFIKRIITQGHSNIIAKEKLRASLQALEAWKAKELRKAEEEKYFESAKLPVMNKPVQKVQLSQMQQIPRTQTLQINKSPPKQTFMQNPAPRQSPVRMSMSNQSIIRKDQKEEFKPSMSAQQPPTPGLSKILPIISQPDISSVECPSPGKQLLINKYGSIQISNLSLSEEEVKQILQEVSQKTRIPVISGVFKAMFDNYIFTAVVSDFVGTRFIIQKKPAMQTPMPGQLPPQFRR